MIKANKKTEVAINSWIGTFSIRKPAILIQKDIMFIGELKKCPLSLIMDHPFLSRNTQKKTAEKTPIALMGT